LAVSCRVVLPVAMNAVLEKPTAVSAASSPGSDGTSAAAAIVAPNPAAAAVKGHSPVRPREATARPPATAPAPMAAVRNP
jgi:hypothetical protein